MRHYSGNLVLAGGTGAYRLPLALNDPVGIWRIEATDVLSGQTVVTEVEVVAP